MNPMRLWSDNSIFRHNFKKKSLAVELSTFNNKRQVRVLCKGESVYKLPS